MSRLRPSRWTATPPPSPRPKSAPAPEAATQWSAGPRGRARWQFGLGSMFQSMFLFSVMAAIYGGMLRSAARKEPFSTVLFVGLSITAPMALMMLLSLWNAGKARLLDWRDARRTIRDQRSDRDLASEPPSGLEALARQRR